MLCGGCLQLAKSEQDIIVISFIFFYLEYRFVTCLHCKVRFNIEMSVSVSIRISAS